MRRRSSIPAQSRTTDATSCCSACRREGVERYLMRAESADGTRFDVAPELVPHPRDRRVRGRGPPRLRSARDERRRQSARHVRDGHRTAAVDWASRGPTTSGRFEFVGAGGEEDVRNGVLFPEKLGGRSPELDRPNRVRFEGGATSGDEIVLSESDDLVDWRAGRSGHERTPTTGTSSSAPGRRR